MRAIPPSHAMIVPTVVTLSASLSVQSAIDFDETHAGKPKSAKFATRNARLGRKYPTAKFLPKREDNFPNIPRKGYFFFVFGGRGSIVGSP
jgi:hypothetical protein